jgi:hypothetical protein
MGASSKSFRIKAVDSAGQPCTLIITEFYRTIQGENHVDKIIVLDNATVETEDGQTLVGGAGKFHSITGAKFTSDDPKAMRS